MTTIPHNTNAGNAGFARTQYADFVAPLVLQSGAVLNNWRLAYQTYGKLNAAKNNAVLICHALSGSQHAAGTDEENNTGWWDNFIGIGKPVDTEKFFVICPNNLGGCHGSTGPASLHPDDNKPYGSRFPVVTVEDWVRSQKMLAAHLGIDCFAAVVGGSLGGMQALRWALDYPNDLRAAVAIAAAAKLSALNIAFNDIARQAILHDPHFCGGDYLLRGEFPRRGLSVARMLGHVTYLSGAAMAAKFGRTRRAKSARFDYETEFEVESYLRYQGAKFSGVFDANTYLLMTRALDYFDPAADGDLADAFSAARAEFFLLSFSSDWRFPPSSSRELARALLASGKRISYMEVQTEEGHDSFLLANPVYHNAVRAFMSRLAARLSLCQKD